MTSRLRCHIKPYIQPFERTLAFAELSALTNGANRDAQARSLPYVEVETSTSVGVLANSLAYWESVGNGRHSYTRQVLREATVNIARNGVAVSDMALALPFGDDPPIPARRCLRYATHGLHEYRGKFFPQLVRALINIGRVPEDGIVGDPMCGSGTTLVESLLAERRTLGLDLNPLSVRLSRAKCLLLKAKPDALRESVDAIRRELNRPRKNGSDSLRYFRQAPAADQAYLRRWFSPGVLHQLDAIVGSIIEIEDEAAREFLFVALSNILRRVSWQKDDDLRVRKEVTAVDENAVAAFLEEVERSLRMLLAFLYQDGRAPRRRFAVLQGDAREVVNLWSRWRGRIDAVITSPPYATALPYLDTDRLSLCYLGMLSRPEHRRRDLQMIGNREITERQRREYCAYFEANEAALPKSVSSLVRKIDRLNTGSEVGFRRRNVAALLAKYFFDMRAVLAGIAGVMKPGRPVYIVVGSNHTIAGGHRVGIGTAELLGDIAEAVGFGRGTPISMEMLHSRDIFRQNASDSETLLSLSAPSHS